MKYNDLFIGDIHAQLSNLPDTKLLLDFVKETALKISPKRIIFLGDLFHTHSVVRQEVIHLYRYYFDILTRITQVWVIVGNHDGVSPSNAQTNICEAVFSGIPNLIVVSDRSTDQEYIYTAFFSDNNQFLDLVNDITINPEEKILVCHQNFDGAMYESGKPAPDGVDSSKILSPMIIAGHIHTYQIIKNKVFFLGTPRMVTKAECNSSKFIYHLQGDSIKSVTLNGITTDHLLKRYIKVRFLEEQGLQLLELNKLNVKDKDDVEVLVEGTEEFYNAFIEKNKSLIGRVGFIPKIHKKLDGGVSIESTGTIKDAMKSYVMDVSDLSKDMKEKVWQKIEKLI